MHYAIVTGVLFGVWPVVARGSGLSPQLIGILVSISTIFVTGVAARGSAVPATGPLLVGLLCGLLNGVAVVCYGKILTSGGQDLSRLLPVVGGIIPLIGAIGGILFFGEALTVAKVGGMAAVITGVFLLNR